MRRKVLANGKRLVRDEEETERTERLREQVRERTSNYKKPMELFI